MEVCSINDVKIYNLAAGKSLPDWLSDRKRRALVRKDSKVRHRIELIQEFEMPTVTTHLRVTPDQQHILACGVYKPRVRCFEVSQLSMKFERCLDFEVVSMATLADDYSKMVFLSTERYVEFHARYGRYHRVRIPRSGRDMKYSQCAAELLFASDGPEVYRLSLEQGQFLKSFESQSAAVNCVQIQDDHNLILLGTSDGTVEAWDPRCRGRVGSLPATVDAFADGMKSLPAVSVIAFRDPLSIGVGTTSGHVLLFDIRADKPYLCKDHLYSMPIKTLDFHDERRVIAADAKALKIYGEDGKIFTSITTAHDINDVCVFARSGLVLVATESPKIQPFYIPALGTAPRWCSFLDNITEELEETNQDTVYDDYKFITVKELEELNLTNLVGTSMLRAYMHGYFVDVRLYHKAKELSQPFVYDEYRKKKIKEKLNAMRADRVPDKRRADLPKVNARVAQRLIEREQELREQSAARERRKRLKKFVNPMRDSRFAEMFENPDFEVDEDTDDFNRLRSVIATLQKPKNKDERAAEVHTFDPNDEEGGVADNESVKSDMSALESIDEALASADDDDDDDDNDNDADVNTNTKADAGKRGVVSASTSTSLGSFTEKSGSEVLRGFRPTAKKVKTSKMSLGERLKSGGGAVQMSRGFASGNRMITYESKKGKRGKVDADHMAERRKVRRSAKGLNMKRM